MDVLRNTQFLKLWGNQVLLQVAFNLCNFTALLLIEQLTSSRFSLAQFYAAMTLPAFMVGIFAGSIVDMTNRKNLMLITDLFLSILFITYAFFTDNFTAILIIAFVSASVSQFFTPAEAATIPMIVKPTQLEHANAMFLFTQLGSVMLGYAVAGPVIQYFGGINNGGAQAAFILGGLLTAVGFFLRLSLKTIEIAQKNILNHQIIIRTLMLTKEVIDETKNNIKISLPIGLLTLMEFSIGMMAILFIDFVKQYLVVPATSTSYFLVLPLIIGLGVGLSFLGLLKRWVTRGKAMFVASVLFGLVVLSLGLSGQILNMEYIGIFTLKVFTVFAAGLIGVCAVFIAVHSRTILQENTPHSMLGRVFSLVTISASAIAPIPVLIVALVTDKLDVTTVFMILGGTLTIGALSLGPTLKKHIQ